MANPLISTLLLNRDISKCPVLEQEDLDVRIAAMESLVFHCIRLLLQISDYPQKHVLELWHRVVSGSVGIRLLYRSEALKVPKAEDLPEEDSLSKVAGNVKETLKASDKASDRLKASWKQTAEKNFMKHGATLIKASLGPKDPDTLVKLLRSAGLSREMYTQIVIDAMEVCEDDKYRDYCGVVDRVAALNNKTEHTAAELQELVDLNVRMHRIENDLGADPRFLYGVLRMIKSYMKQHTTFADQIGTAYLRLVVKNAQQRKVAGESQSPDDDRQNGVFGLIRAIRMYDHRTGARFASYASYWIQQAIRYRSKMQTNMIRQPNSLWDSYNKLERTRRILEERDPEAGQITYQQLSKETGLSLKQIEKVYARVITSQVRSLDFNMEGEGSSDTFTLQDVTSQEHLEEETDTSSTRFLSRVGQLLQNLPEEEARVIALRFGLLDHLASEDLDINLVAEERIRQLTAATLLSQNRGTNKETLENY